MELGVRPKGLGRGSPKRQAEVERTAQARPARFSLARELETSGHRALLFKHKEHV